MSQDSAVEDIVVEVTGGVARVRLNRPAAANALHEPMWFALRDTMRALDADPAVRVVVISGNGRHFCSGIDVSMLAGLEATAADPSPGHGADRLRRTILDLQDCLTAVERCRVPVIAAVQGACVGAGLDLAVACDLRHATADASFVLKEVDMGLAADVGVLQRLPRIVGEGVARELAYTCRPVSGNEAASLRLVNGVHPDADALEAAVSGLAADLAAKSPLALRGTKHAITYARDHSVADGLEQIATWNAGALISADLREAVAAFTEKRPAVHRD
ncbi:crotonase/enoyl-CoA hydratase family protein [Pseudonocardia nematodicida]|uniref:Crotonase/enoyl-CoA hydratase family protein n=1 Tax=Pseudonocardia nematodicida TaxID=1206997 RepID=A0ABV1KA78_9PSEU